MRGGHERMDSPNQVTEFDKIERLEFAESHLAGFVRSARRWAALRRFVRSQEALDEEAQAALYENLWEMYEEVK